MIYRFLMLSDEVDDFRREYRLDSDASFLEFHDTILESVGYERGEMTSFFICGDDWSRKTEITRFEMNTKSEMDSIIMEDTLLSDYLEDERQKLMFVFDYLNDRAFYMELREIIFGENINKAEVTKSIGRPPIQLIPIEEEEIVAKTPPPTTPTPLLDDDMDDYIVDDYNESYSDDGYNEDELDEDGFDEMDEDGERGDINIDELDI